MFRHLYSVSLMAVALLAIQSKLVTGEGCPGEFYLMVNGDDDNQISLPEDFELQLCAGVPFNIWFEPDDSNVDNVKFVLDDGPKEQCEREKPFALFGDYPPGTFKYDTLPVGPHKIEVFCGVGDEFECGSPSNFQYFFQVIDCPDFFLKEIS